MTPPKLTPADIWRWRNHVSADKSLFTSTRLVMLRLSFHADPDKGGLVWASQALLAGEVGMPRSSVQRHLATAREHGWLEISERRRNVADRYRMTFADSQLSYPDRTTTATMLNAGADSATSASGPIQVGPLLSDPDRTEVVLPRSDMSSPFVAPSGEGTTHGAETVVLSASADAAAASTTLLADLVKRRPPDWSAPVVDPWGKVCIKCGEPADDINSFDIWNEVRHTWCLPTPAEADRAKFLAEFVAGS